MESKEKIKKLAKEIIRLELEIQDCYDSAIFDKMQNLMKDLNINELIELEEEINKHMGMSSY